MSQKIIIDGYNVLHKIDDYRKMLELDLESARNQLIRDLQTYKSRRRLEITVVFDGSAEAAPAPEQSKLAGVTVIYSHAPLKADPVIMDIIKNEKRKRRLTIVTDDGEIRRFAKDSGSDSMSPANFIRRIKSQSGQTNFENKYNSDMSAEELREWEKLFGVDGDEE
ncbi:hypothetical protein GF337_14960 [candidate division KSB1 bacterium]|nr:hypothetical protein [candidate division KSB1 bacterium]